MTNSTAHRTTALAAVLALGCFPSPGLFSRSYNTNTVRSAPPQGFPRPSSQPKPKKR